MALPPKAFDVLVTLVRNAGQLVTKQELLDAVWREAFVEEGIISVALPDCARYSAEIARSSSKRFPGRVTVLPQRSRGWAPVRAIRVLQYCLHGRSPPRFFPTATATSV